MNAIRTIARKEYQLAMRSVTTYIVFVLFLVISGSFFATTVFKVGLAELRALYTFQHLLFVFFIPAITMGSIARERGSGTIELLSTLPIRLSHVIWGKILSAFMQVFTMMIFNVIPLIIVAIFGQNIDYNAIILGFFGMMLLSAAFVSIGVFASSLPSNQVLAFVIAFFIGGSIYVIRYLMALVPLSLVRYVQYFTFDYHLSSFMKGVFDLRDLLFFIAVIVIFATLAELNLQSRNMMQER
ncbi:MAG: ABC transporter permease subunit [Candidatus Cloacimonadales bacterium]|jgi:ABC-2 type transport system permease protein|nr:ABC transporter permease subunit [Candidatus Cloacimonadota bacterium]MDY0381064.1 ABC transporter permease subunit [Candidatus Cloacimonadaceae bacterium]HCM16590.1 ABC transporter permease [Candidatus Cloacimonas sp.]MCB5257256.1 ABC transporter permease subunit [Candidatus Cloacimonadota bacterium]MCB5263499.1 ABC transporter permease subunit [Candidatus Cloacimonadota bacterium]